MPRDDWKATMIHMMDFEGSEATGVVEFGVVTLFEGKVLQTWTGLCQSEGEIPQRDKAVHGISRDQTEKEVPFREHFDAFATLRSNGVFAAHNRFAENSFLKRTWSLAPKVPDWKVQGGICNSWEPWIDTLELYRRIYPGMEGYGLGELTAQFQLQDALDQLVASHCPAGRQRPHCALYDALASSLLLTRLETLDGFRDNLRTGWLLQNSGALEPQGELFQ
jgi:DNA polymerase III epsilon subunit-like protein